MKIMIYMMIAMISLIIVISIVLIVRMLNRNSKFDEGHNVFKISNDKLTVLAGIPVTYYLTEIHCITFSTVKSARSSNYQGVMRVIKTSGKKSRPFLFTGNVYTKKHAIFSTKDDIEESIQYLMKELSDHYIASRRVK